MLQHFQNPPVEYRLCGLWVWDCQPDASEVERQIREMHATGFGGFVIERDPAYAPDSADANMLRCLERAARTAAELGLRAFLNDRSQQHTAHWGQDYSKFLYHLGQHASGGKCTNLTRTSLGTLARFADSPWNTPFEDVKRAIDWQVALGVPTVLAPRLPLGRARAHSGDFRHFYEMPQWPLFGLLTDYAARLSYAMSQGKSNAQIALLEPSCVGESGFRLTTRRSVDQYCSLLIKEHIGFDLISEESLIDATCVDQRLLIAGSSYEALLLPPMTRIALAAAKKVREFADDGGVVVGTGLLPYADQDGCARRWLCDTFRELFGADPIELENQGRCAVPSAAPQTARRHYNTLLLPITSERDMKNQLRKHLESVIRLPVSVKYRSVECEDIVFAQRIITDAELFFFANTSAQARDVQLSIRSRGAPQILDLETGESYALANCAQQGDRTLLLHRFERYASALIFFGTEPVLKVKRLTCGIEGCEAASSSNWHCTEADGARRCVCRLSLRTPRLNRAESLVVRALHTRGIVTFRINGIEVGVRAWAPFEVDITRFVEPGENCEIEVEEMTLCEQPAGHGRKTVRLVIC